MYGIWRETAAGFTKLDSFFNPERGPGGVFSLFAFFGGLPGIWPTPFAS